MISRDDLQKENRLKRLTEKDQEKVAGGFASSNKYPKEVYHAAGMVTMYAYFDSDRWAFACSSKAVYNYSMLHDEANKFADYYLSHTNEEYIKFVSQTLRYYDKIVPGWDCPQKEEW